MSNAAVAVILDRWAGPHDGDLDATLLARFLADREGEAFAALVRRHGPLVYGTCRRVLGNRADADDAFQAVFFVLARRAHTVKADRGIGPWLYGVALRVAMKHRGQLVRRRLRDMAAAKSERVDPADPGHDFWAIVDEELARLAAPHREVVVLCDLGGRSHAQAAEALGLAKGTVTKRLAKARDELAARLRRRGVTLGAGALATLIATQATAAVPTALLLETARQAVAFAIGPVAGSATATTLAEGVMRSLQLGVLKGYALVGLCAVALAGGGLLLAQAPANTGGPKAEQSRSVAAPPAAKPGTMWKENYAVEYTGSLPVSVAFAPDGKTLLAGDTSGEVMALIFPGDEPVYRWKARAEGSHAAVAYSADGKTVYVTTRHGVLVLDAADGKTQARIEAKDSAPTAVGVFPDKPFAETHTESKIIFGTAQGYLVKSWVDGKPETAGTIEVTTTPKGHAPADAAAVPLAVDPAGRSAICAGPRLGDRPVLWAYVCGDHAEGSPGNRVLDGHAAAVVSAAWAKDGATAATGDAAGRVIVWDAKTMKETRRLELGGRVMALALSTDGARTAAAVRTKLGSEVHVWDTATPPTPMKPIHTYFADYGSEPSASLSFSPDGKRLAGCAIDKKWAQLPKAEVRGKVRVWELAAEPKAQRPPKPAYTINLPKGSSSNFVILNNHSIVLPSSEAGGIDFRNLQDGHIQFRLGLGAFTLGGLKLSADRQWLAVEQRAIPDPKAATFEVGVYSAMPKLIATIPACGQLLDIAPGGKRVAVVRDQRIELWDPTTTKLAKAAPFKHTRIDAASFSPDGKRLALADGAELVLWRVDDDTHERIDLGRPVGSLAFSPDGKFLAEGPTPGESIRIRDVETGKVVQSLATGPKQSMTVPRLAFAQGGRLLVTADTAGPPRITLWDAATGGLAHPIALPAGVPHALDVSPNGRYLVATLEDAAGVKLTAWRLDGETPPPEAGPTPPAATPRR